MLWRERGERGGKKGEEEGREVRTLYIVEDIGGDGRDLEGSAWWPSP